MEPHERRKQILEGAKVVFAEQGYHAAGVADIIQQAGIARGTFYLYFKSKRDVFTALLESIFQSLHEQLTALPESPEKIVPALLENFETVKEYFFADPHLAKIVFQESVSLDPESYQHFQDVRQSIKVWLKELLSTWQDNKMLRSDLDPEIMAISVIGAGRELFDHFLIAGTMQADMSKITKDFLELFVFGIVDPEQGKLAREHIESVVK